MKNPFFLSLLAFIAPNLLVSAADGLDGWVPDKFRRLYSHASIVVDDTVYIVGGEVHLQDKDDFHVSALDSTLSISLQSSWTNSSVKIQAQLYPSGFPYMNVQNLWWDMRSKSIYSYGGGTTVAGDEGTNTVDPLSVWAFLPDNNTWTERYGPNDDMWDTMTRATRCASAYTPKSGYCLGGYSGAWSTPVDAPDFDMPISGMVELDFETSTWSNVSSVGSSQNGWTISQQMEYVPSYGQEGILIAMGGHDLDQEQYKIGQDLRSMSNITIYDIHTKTWHSQTATGDVPNARSDFCSVSAQGSNDTYEIFVFGGTDGRRDGPDNDQVYVLSLPAFRWFQTEAGTQHRYKQTCEIVGGRQMLSIGGANPQESNTVDPFDYGLGIFDMVDWKWKPRYDANAGKYESADTVKKFYQENSRYPTWDSDGVKAMIKDSTDPPQSSNTDAPDEPSNTDVSDKASETNVEPSSPSDDAIPVGAIAGGVVGGVAGIALIVALIFFLLRRKRKARDSPEGPKELDVPPEYGSKGSLSDGPGELGDDSAVHLKDNTHPRSWDSRINELDGHEQRNELEAGRTPQEYYRGQPVRAPPRVVTELES